VLWRHGVDDHVLDAFNDHCCRCHDDAGDDHNYGRRSDHNCSLTR
jgi:hypothetical protein